jgi:hypothetical protein
MQTAKPLPVRGLHAFAPNKEDARMCEEFVREVLPKQGVNLLVLEFNYNFAYRSHPELGSADALDAAGVKALVKTCRAAGIKLVPQFNCLGHQSWAKTTYALLKKHPEFDETPALLADNPGIYCRSWCPLHPDVHKIVFELIDELADACEAEALHVGMDEVFILADKSCPRCAGKDPAELFAGEVKLLRDHLAEKKRALWLWGDRLLDGDKTGTGKWEGSQNGTQAAMAKVPKDVVICDWHYTKAFETPKIFVENGFSVIACPWRKADVALAQLKIIRGLAETERPNGGKALGMLQTTWTGFPEFIKAWNGKSEKVEAKEAAECFRQLTKAMRGE